MPSIRNIIAYLHKILPDILGDDLRVYTVDDIYLFELRAKSGGLTTGLALFLIPKEYSNPRAIYRWCVNLTFEMTSDEIYLAINEAAKAFRLAIKNDKAPTFSMDGGDIGLRNDIGVEDGRKSMP